MGFFHSHRRRCRFHRKDHEAEHVDCGPRLLVSPYRQCGYLTALRCGERYVPGYLEYCATPLCIARQSAILDSAVRLDSMKGKIMKNMNRRWLLASLAIAGVA